MLCFQVGSATTSILGKVIFMEPLSSRTATHSLQVHNPASLFYNRSTCLCKINVKAALKEDSQEEEKCILLGNYWEFLGIFPKWATPPPLPSKNSVLIKKKENINFFARDIFTKHSSHIWLFLRSPFIYWHWLLQMLLSQVCSGHCS